MKNNLHRFVLLLLFGLTSFVSGEPVAGPLKAYRLKIDDELQLSVFLQPDLAKRLTIDRQGKVSVPMIEKAIPLVGLTRAEAVEKIRQAYADGFLKFPVVDLKITQFAQDFVKISGRVMRPGDIPIHLPGKLDLLTALTIAGGVSPFADTEAIKLITAGGDNATFTLKEVRGKKGKRLLNPGDQIIVPGNRFANMAVSMEGKIVKPGPIPIPKGGKLDLASAMVLAGGISDHADLSKIELIPANGGKSSIFSYDEVLQGVAGKTLLKAGDRVVVGKSPFVNGIVIMEGAVLRRGPLVYSMGGKFTLKSALSRAGLSDLANREKVEVSRKGSKTVRYNMVELNKIAMEIYLHPGDTIKVFTR